MKTNLKFFLFLWMASAEAQTSKNLHSLLFRLHKTDQSSYYGTAILFRIEKERAFLLTNSHLIPKTTSEQLKMRASGPLGVEMPSEVKFVGRSLGEDIAVLEIPVPGHSQIVFERLRSELLPVAFWNASLQEIHARDAYLIGVQNEITHAKNPNEWDKSELPWLVFTEALKFTTGERPEGLKRITPEELHRAFQTKTLKTIKNCPQYFLRECYVLNLPSWGFSGGALVVTNPKEASSQYIAGLVSHYRFLSPETYIIPIVRALQSAERIIQSRTDIINDDSGTFAAVDERTIRRLKDGAFIQQAIADVPGGPGDVNGGGPGDINAGGSTGEFIPSTVIHLPQSFGNGLLRLMTYRPGIILGNRTYLSAVTPEGSRYPIEDLSDYIQLFIRHPSFELESSPLRVPLSEQMAAKGPGSGFKVEANEFKIQSVSGLLFLRGSQVSHLFVNREIKSTREEFSSTFFLDGLEIINLHMKQVGNDEWRGEGRFRSKLSILVPAKPNIPSEIFAGVARTSGQIQIILTKSELKIICQGFRQNEGQENLMSYLDVFSVPVKEGAPLQEDTFKVFQKYLPD